MRALYPVCQVAELAAGYRDTTRRTYKPHTCWNLWHASTGKKNGVVCTGSMLICDSIARTMQGPSVCPRKVFMYSKPFYLEGLPCLTCIMQRGALSAHCGRTVNMTHYT